MSRRGWVGGAPGDQLPVSFRSKHVNDAMSYQFITFSVMFLSAYCQCKDSEGWWSSQAKRAA